jgi:hypothetical protein
MGWDGFSSDSKCSGSIVYRVGSRHFAGFETVSSNVGKIVYGCMIE